MTRPEPEAHAFSVVRATSAVRSSLVVDGVHSSLAALGPERFARALGISKIARGRGAVRVPCPIHGGHDPNCCIGVRDGRLVYFCHSGCGAGGDALDFVAAVHGLDVRRQFADVLAVAAEIGGERPGARAVLSLSAGDSSPPSPREYPPEFEVADLWACCRPLSADRPASEYLVGRGLSPALMEDIDLARVLPLGRALPRWAWSRAGSWRESDHTILAPAYDERGSMRSLRAMRVSTHLDTSKRLNPTGDAAGGLVLADALGQILLRDGTAPGWWGTEPLTIVIAEGEPDHWTWATRQSPSQESACAVLALTGSGSWTQAHADRIPGGAHVAIRTDHDPPGERYSRAIAQTLRGRCQLWRPRRSAP